MAYPRLSKIGWMDNFSKLNLIAECSSSRILLIGDSLISGLSRYESVWKTYFFKRNTLNCGFRGDRCLNVLWRAKFMVLPQSVKHIIIHCGTNDLNNSTPVNIANILIEIGVTLKQRLPNSFIIITGLLPRDLNFSSKRSSIERVNFILKDECVKNGFSFVIPDNEWVTNGVLNQRLYYDDWLHLSEKGNMKFSESMISAINASTSKTKSETKLYSEINNFNGKQYNIKHFPSLSSSISCPSVSVPRQLYSSVVAHVTRPVVLSVVPHVVMSTVVQPVTSCSQNVLYVNADVVPISVATVAKSLKFCPAMLML